LDEKRGNLGPSEINIVSCLTQFFSGHFGTSIHQAENNEVLANYGRKYKTEIYVD